MDEPDCLVVVLQHVRRPPDRDQAVAARPERHPAQPDQRRQRRVHGGRERQIELLHLVPGRAERLGRPPDDQAAATVDVGHRRGRDDDPHQGTAPFGSRPRSAPSPSGIAAAISPISAIRRISAAATRERATDITRRWPTRRTTLPAKPSRQRPDHPPPRLGMTGVGGDQPVAPEAAGEPRGLACQLRRRGRPAEADVEHRIHGERSRRTACRALADGLQAVVAQVAQRRTGGRRLDDADDRLLVRVSESGDFGRRSHQARHLDRRDAARSTSSHDASPPASASRRSTTR